MATEPNASAQQPYFFLSYAHSPRLSPGDDLPDKPIRDFYRDLSEQIAWLVGRSPDDPVGFADWEIQAGRPWRNALSQALSTCRVFIALCTPDYFERSFCGQEWAAFQRRELVHRAQTKEEKTAIIPVMWKRMDDEHMPPAARRIQYLHHEAGELYRARGMRELVVRRNRAEIDQAYGTALRALAKRVIDVANTDPLQPLAGAASQLDPDENAFAGDWNRKDPRPLRLVSVAPVRESLPSGATAEKYGSSAEQWRPYWPADATPITRTTVLLSRTVGFQPIVETIDECPDLRRGIGPTAPTLLLVDPWSAQVPELTKLLRAFDEISYDKPWVRLAIPWDSESADSGERAQLENGLQRVLGRTCGHNRIANPQAVAGLATVTDFAGQLPSVIASAERGYLRRVTTVPPPDNTLRLPRLVLPQSHGKPADADDGREGGSDVRRG